MVTDRELQTQAEQLDSAFEQYERPIVDYRGAPLDVSAGVITHELQGLLKGAGAPLIVVEDAMDFLDNVQQAREDGHPWEPELVLSVATTYVNIVW